MTKRTHPLVVKIDRELFDQVRAMLIATDDGRHQRRNHQPVPWGAWSDLIDTILRQWLATQERHLANVKHAKEYARHG